MIRRWGSVDTVALTGVVIGIPSAWLGWSTFKTSRIVSGTGLGLADTFGWAVPVIITALWLVCLAAAFYQRNRTTAVVMGLAANTVLVLGFVLSGLAAGRLLEGEDAAARVSLGTGFWISLLACYIVIFAARQRLKYTPVLFHFISWGGAIVCLVLLFAGWLNDISVLRELAGREERFIQELWHHIYLVGISVGIGAVLGILLGFWATRNRFVERPIFFITNITQTIPSLALFGLLIAPLSALSFAYPFLRDIGIRGVGNTPAIIALVIYSLLPIVRNTYVGLKNVEPAVINAGTGMGMSRFQVFRQIEAPLAAPLVLEGVRTASVQSVGLTAVAALIGAGGLGSFIFLGLGQAASDLIILGTIPIIALALIVDAIMRNVVRVATPRGITGGHR